MQYNRGSRYLQNNPRLHVWNELVTTLLNSEFSSHVFEVQVWDATIHDFEHGDNVHMKRAYYDALAQLFRDD